VGDAGGTPPRWHRRPAASYTRWPTNDDRSEDVLDRVSDGFFAVDSDWLVTYINRAGEESHGVTADELVDEVLWDVFPEAVGTQFYDAYHRAVETGEPVTFESYYEPLESWFEVRVFPSESGLSVYFGDVTERRRMETELRRERSLLERVTPGHAGVRVRRAGVRRRTRHRDPDGSRLWLSVNAVPHTDADGTVRRVVTAFEDVTDRREREADLESATRQFEVLSRILRHDVRNDVPGLGWAGLLEERLDDRESLELLARIRRTGQDALRLTETGKDVIEVLSTDGTVPLEPVSVRDVLSAELSKHREMYPHAEFRVEGGGIHRGGPKASGAIRTSGRAGRCPMTAPGCRCPTTSWSPSRANSARGSTPSASTGR